MSTEQSLLVAVPRDAQVEELVADIASAADRASKADPGDRVEVIRYEALCVQLEALAARHLALGAEHRILAEELPETAGFSFAAPWMAGGSDLRRRIPQAHAAPVERWLVNSVVVELRLPLEFGPTAVPSEAVPAAAVAERWQADDGVSGSKAVTQRFRAQLEAAINNGGVGSQCAIMPSGIHNRVITEILREFVEGSLATRIDAPVAYRDGSQASHRFPLRCLPLVRQLPPRADVELRLALLSIRHTEMDAVMDGAWLRNAEVSRPRPAALTDDFVYETSRRQLAYITDGGRRTVTLHIYQTGLDAAVVGFYRSVAHHLLDYPYSVSIVPMFYMSRQASHAHSQPAGQDGQFKAADLPWTMGRP